MAKDDGEEKIPTKVTDIDAAAANVEASVETFAKRFLSMPRFTEHCVVMDQGQLRDAMGLRASLDVGDPWPAAEQLLMGYGFRWHTLGGMRVMYLQEREDCEPDTGWVEAEEISE